MAVSLLPHNLGKEPINDLVVSKNTSKLKDALLNVSFCYHNELMECSGAFTSWNVNELGMRMCWNENEEWEWDSNVIWQK